MALVLLGDVGGKTKKKNPPKKRKKKKIKERNNRTGTMLVYVMRFVFLFLPFQEMETSVSKSSWKS